MNAQGFSASVPTSCPGNVIEDLQLEVDHSQIVVIDRNTVKRGMRRAGIGIFTIGDKAIAEDWRPRLTQLTGSLTTGSENMLYP